MSVTDCVSAFPLLVGAPELRDVIGKLDEDHRLMGGLLRQVEQLTGQLPDEPMSWTWWTRSWAK